jgi:hypothetical protein
MSTPPITQVKDKYKIRNWKAYNKSLCQRGSLTLWLDDSVLQEWEQASKKPKSVGEQTYSDSIIQCCLLLKNNYGLKLRQSTGFMQSLFMLMGKGHFVVPDYSSLNPSTGLYPFWWNNEETKDLWNYYRNENHRKDSSDLGGFDIQFTGNIAGSFRVNKIIVTIQPC